MNSTLGCICLTSHSEKMELCPSILLYMPFIFFFFCFIALFRTSSARLNGSDKNVYPGLIASLKWKNIHVFIIKYVSSTCFINVPYQFKRWFTSFLVCLKIFHEYILNFIKWFYIFGDNHIIFLVYIDTINKCIDWFSHVGPNCISGIKHMWSCCIIFYYLF